MATSNSGFWTSGVGAWLSSPKNLAGSFLAIAAVGAQLVVGLGVFWPAVVAGAYTVGALLAPRGRIDLRLGVGAGATAAQLHDQLGVLERSGRRLDDEARGVLEPLLGQLDEVVQRWDELADAPEHRHLIEQIIGDYLPTSMQRYLNLPRGYTPGGARRSARDELMEQLGILSTESGRIRDAVYAKGLDALGDQSRFLRERFRRSSLDLGADPPA